MVRLTENFFLKIISEAKMLSIKKITQLAKENSTPLYIFDKDELADRFHRRTQLFIYTVEFT